MAGGSGTRFWPKSTRHRPKQLLSFSKNGKTLIQETVERFEGLVPKDLNHRLIVTTERLQGAIEDQTRAQFARALAEPTGRNTAPCVYWAAREVFARDPQGVMMIMPADHYIPRTAEFRKTLEAAKAWAETHDDLVTLGVMPTRPETGYGYLKVGTDLGQSSGEACRKVDAFVEKPNLEKATQFLSSGNYLWNGGMFVWRAEVVLKAFDEFMPEMKQVWDKYGGDVKKAYPELTATSVDYGIMEKARNVVTFTLDCGWDDLGAWTSLESVADATGTRTPDGVVAAGEVLSIESSGNIVDAPGKFVALLGVKDLILVEHEGKILVAPKSRAQDIRLVIEGLKSFKPDLL